MRVRVRGGWYDTSSLRFRVDERRGRLSPREGELLEFLRRRLGAPQSRETLLQDVFGYHPKVKSRALDLAVFRLRKKIEQDPGEPMHLQTVPQVGYRLVLDESTDEVDAPAGPPRVHSALVERALADRDGERLLGGVWADLDAAQQRALATLSLFRAPAAPQTIGRAFGPDLQAQAELLQQEGVLAWEGRGLAMSRSLRAMAAREVRDTDLDAFRHWALSTAELSLRWEGSRSHAPLVAHSVEILELARGLSAEEAVLLRSAVLWHMPLVSARQLGRLEESSQALDGRLRAKALQTLLRHRLESPDVLGDWAEELERLMSSFAPVDEAQAWLAVHDYYRSSGTRPPVDDAFELLERLDDAPGLTSQLWLRIGNGAQGVPRREAFEKAAEAAKRADSPLLLALGLGGLATSAERATEETLDLVRLAVDLVPSRSMTHSVVLTNLASVALLCDPEAAVPLCAEALARARAGVRPSLLGMALVMHSDLDRVQGRPELALDRLEEATEVLEGTRTWLDAQLRIVATHAELGQQAIARVLLDSLPPAQTRSQRMVALAARAHLVLAETGETAEATRILQALDTQQLGTMVQDQVDLAVELHRGLWAPPSP